MAAPLGFGQEVSMQDFRHLTEHMQCRTSDGQSVPVVNIHWGYKGKKVVIDGKEWGTAAGVDYAQFNFSQQGNFWYNAKNQSDYIYVLEAQDGCCTIL